MDDLFAGLPGVRTWTAMAAWVDLFILGPASLARAPSEGWIRIWMERGRWGLRCTEYPWDEFTDFPGLDRIGLGSDLF